LCNRQGEQKALQENLIILFDRRKEEEMSSNLKVHVALNVNNIEESVRFYSAMFGAEPVKLKPGYAKFDIAEPGLNLTLNYQGEVKDRGALNHLGIQVESTASVREAKERLQSAGLATFEENNTDCCYALQDKVWVTDPNGYRWEVFVVKVGDTQPELTLATAQAGACGTHLCCR
jgi:catechol 2,3-dioxygenase-like lactoylglutathione lyase family enzyme